MFGLSALATKAIAGAVIAAALVGAWYGIKTYYYNQGWAAAIVWVDEQNRKALENADAKENDRKKCIDSGRSWDNADGVCR